MYWRIILNLVIKMIYKFINLILIIAFISLSTGCSTTTNLKANQPYINESIHGAFVDENFLYLIGNKQDYRVLVTPFHKYKLLTESHLKNNIVCNHINAQIHKKQPRDNNLVGTFRVLLDYKNINQSDIDKFNLKKVVVKPNSHIYPELFEKFSRQENCNLKDTNYGTFYLAEFTSTGKILIISNRNEALKKSVLARPLVMDLNVNDPSKMHQNNKGITFEDALDVMEVIVKAPFYILGLFFVQH